MRDATNRLSDIKRRKRRRTLLILFTALLFFSVFLLRVWFSSNAVELAYEIDRLSAEKEALEEENKKLLLEIAKLESPERISEIATVDLNMIRPSDAEVIMLER